MKKALIVIAGTIVSGVCLGLNNLNGENNVQTVLGDKVTRTEPSSTTQYKRDSLYKFEHAFIEENEMPIVGLLPPTAEGAAGTSAPSFVTRSHMQRFKDAGFNIYYPCYERMNFKEPLCREIMQMCNEMGLVYFVNDSRFMGVSGADGTIEGYQTELIKSEWEMKEPCYGGITLKDEPNYADFEEMAKVFKAYKELYGEKTLVVTTLFPSYGTDEQLGLNIPETEGMTYQEKRQFYVDSFVNMMEPSYLACDYYIWHTRNSNLDDLDYLSGFFTSLSQYMKHTKERNIPVWTTIATYKHGKPAPYNDEETFWTTNISLAYGVKGVQYYIYWPQMEGYDSGDYLNDPYLRGMVDSSGMPLDAYYRVQKMNRQIKAVDQALMPSMPKGILQFGNLKIDIPKEDQLSEFGELKTVTGGDSFVGCFDNNGKSVYYVVNNNLGDWSGSKILGNSIFKMDFKKKVNVRFTNVDSGEKTINNAYSICFNLKPGEAMLVEVL